MPYTAPAILPSWLRAVGFAPEVTEGLPPGVYTLGIPYDSAIEFEHQPNYEIDKAARNAPATRFGPHITTVKGINKLNGWLWPVNTGYVIGSVMGSNDSLTASVHTYTPTAPIVAGATTFTASHTIPYGQVFQLFDSVAGVAESCVQVGGTPTSPSATVTLAAPTVNAYAQASTVLWMDEYHKLLLPNNTAGQGRSFTFVMTDGVDWRAYSGGKPTELTLKYGGEGGLLTYESAWENWGEGAANPAGTPATLAYEAVEPLMGWQGTTMFADVPSVRVLSCEVALKRGGKAEYAMRQSNQPTSIYQGALMCDVKFSAMYLDRTELDKYKTGTHESFAVAFAAPSSNGSAPYGLVVHVGDATYKKVSRKYQEDGYTKIDVELEGNSNAFDNGAEASVFLTNSHATAY